jgi:peptide/nickel transport system substrate-binding protein
MIASFDPDVRIEMPYFPEYWKGWPDKRLDGWYYDIHREHATLKQLLASGDVHFTERLTTDEAEELAENPNIVVQEDVGMTPFQFKLNNQKEPTSNRDFRKALTYALNYEAIVEGVFGGHATYLDSPVPSTFESSISLLTPERDIDRARQHLEASGYDPAETTLVYQYISGDPRQRDMGLVFRDSLKELGIEVEVEGLVAAVAIETFSEVETTANVFPIWANSDYPDAEIILYPQYHSRNHGNWYSCSWYENEEFDRLMDDARQTIRKEDRIPKYQELQRILADDAVDIWIFSEHTLGVMRDCVKGYFLSPAGMQAVEYYSMYLEGEC